MGQATHGQESASRRHAARTTVTGPSRPLGAFRLLQTLIAPGRGLGVSSGPGDWDGRSSSVRMVREMGWPAAGRGERGTWQMVVQVPRLSPPSNGEPYVA